MASPRLTFLYPQLFRSVRVSDTVNTAFPKKASPQSQCRTAALHSSPWRLQHFPSRHGTAIEPMQQSADESPSKFDQAPTAKESPSKKGNSDAASPNEAQSHKPKIKKSTESASTSRKNINDSQLTKGDKPLQKDSPAAQKSGDQAVTLSENAPTLPDPKPLETVLHMDPPSSSSGGRGGADPKPPHLQAPPYVHHFDTYTLVRDLERGGFTEDQSVTAMKAVRGLLALNLDVAKEGLVSKSDVENETYLFRAACSELRTEIQNNRKAEADKLRTLRAQLQHEVDILNQKTTQESLSLKDELKGMFDDRKMAVRTEQRGMDSSIQELNYKITVSLNSDMKSEVEGLRWVLTRRAAMAIATMAFLILGSLRYSSYQMHLQEMSQRKKHPSSSTGAKGGEGREGGENARGARGGGGDEEKTSTGDGNAPAGSAEMLARLNEGSSPSYVSLG